MSAPNLKESFSWMSSDFKTQNAGKDTIKIKGIALRSDTVSRNNRKYVDAELIKSARTFIGRPVTINHSMERKVGHVDWAEYEDGCLEYLATIKKQPYVDMLRDKSTAIKGVSVEALYLKNMCTICHNPFDTEEQFRDHMKQEHFITIDPTKEVHGMVGQALSLVLSPEECGVENTTIELAESTNRLFETIIKEKGEKNMVETPTTKEQEKPEKSCPLGQVLNPQSGQCEDIQEILGKLDEIFKVATKDEMRDIYEHILSLADKTVDETRAKMKGEQGIIRAVEMLADLTNHAQKTCIGVLETKNSNLTQETIQDQKTWVIVELENLATEIARTNKRITAIPKPDNTLTEKHLQETEANNKTAKELEDLKMEVKTLQENMQTILRGRFKGISPDNQPEPERATSARDPLKGGK